MGDAYQAWLKQFETTETIKEVIIGATRPECIEIMRKTLEKHQCTYETLPDASVKVTFPEGTQRIEIWPRVHTTRYRVVLPDKYEMQLHHLPNSVNVLGFPEDLVGLANAEQQ